MIAQVQGASSDDSLSSEEREAGIEKLRLEISALKKQPAWYSPYLEATPLIAVVFTLIGLWAGAIKYFNESGESRSIDRRTQIRADLDQILSFPSDDKISLARVVFLFHDLENLTASDNAAKANVSVVVEKLIENDLDFDKLRDLSFDVAALLYWPGYAQRLQERGGSRELRYKYVQAFRHLYEENKAYVSSIHFDRTVNEFVVKEFTPIETQFLRLAQLMTGYGQHIRFIPDEVKRKEARDELAAAIHNPGLVENYLKT